MIERVWLTRDDLVRCYETARARDAIKAEHTNRQVSSRDGWHLHFDGLRGELAVASALDCRELVSWTIDRHGDGGCDLRVSGLSYQIKASTYYPPYLRFDVDGPQCFKADRAILVLLPKLPACRDDLWSQRSGWVDIYGWLSFGEFSDRAERINFGYGDRLMVKPPLNDFRGMLS